MQGFVIIPTRVFFHSVYNNEYFEIGEKVVEMVDNVVALLRYTSTHISLVHKLHVFGEEKKRECHKIPLLTLNNRHLH